MKFVNSDSYRSSVKKRSFLSWSLVSVIIGLVVIFIVMTNFVPQLVNIPIVQGSTITLGIIFAFTIIVLIFVMAAGYVRWNNLESTRMLEEFRKQKEG